MLFTSIYSLQRYSGPKVYSGTNVFIMVILLKCAENRNIKGGIGIPAAHTRLSNTTQLSFTGLLLVIWVSAMATYLTLVPPRGPRTYPTTLTPGLSFRSDIPTARNTQKKN